MSAHTFGDPIFDRLFEFEAVIDAPAPAAAPEPSSAPADPGAPEPAAVDPGAAAPATPEPGAPEPSIDDFFERPEAQERVASLVEQTITQRETAAREAEAAAQREAEAQTEFSDVEEALGLLGITPDRFKAYIGKENEPMAKVAERMQQAEALEWVDGKLTALGKDHPALLGDDVTKLAELTDAEGKALFNPEEVAQVNRQAVLFAASGLQGAHGFSHEQALTEASKAVQGRDEVVGKIAVQRYIRELEASGKAPTNLSGDGTGGVTHLSGVEGGDELSLARRWAAEHASR